MSTRVPSPPPSTRPSARYRWLHLRDAERPRYSPANFSDFIRYNERTTRGRHLTVIVASAIPCLITSLLAPLIPLQDPCLGVRANASFFASFFVSYCLALTGGMMEVRGCSGLPHRDLSHTSVVAVGLLGGLFTTATFAAAAVLWRFPVPFSCVSLTAPLMSASFVALLIVLRGALIRRESAVRRALIAIFPFYSVQSFQLLIYTGLSLAFQATNEIGQITLIIFIPFVKHGIRHILRRLTRHLPVDGNQCVLCSVEISASMCQSMLMQSTSSPYATALMIAIDICQTLVSIYLLMAKDTDVATGEIVSHAVAVMSINAKPDSTSNAVVAFSPPHGKSLASVHPVTVRTAPSASVLPVATRALELLHAAESLVLIEYFEVALPAVNGAFLSAASQLQSAEYSPKLRLYRHRPEELQRALVNLAIYTGLQALSFVILHAVLWRRYRLNATALLAFLLERQAWAVQGNLIGWLAITFQLPVLHYGFDVSFRFDFVQPPLV